MGSWHSPDAHQKKPLSNGVDKGFVNSQSTEKTTD